VQVLLVDGSTFTVGIRSSLVIDKFVCNPHKGTGEMTATLTKGASRFKGGKLSKQEPAVKINTPAGWLTVHRNTFRHREQFRPGGLRLHLLSLYGSQSAKSSAIPSSTSGTLFAGSLKLNGRVRITPSTTLQKTHTAHPNPGRPEARAAISSLFVSNIGS